MKQLKGYIFSRAFMGERVPQHVQNLVIRDYCQKNGYQYLLSGTEYAMEGCHLVFEQLLDEIQEYDGIALYSLFQLPESSEDREVIYHKVLDLNKSLHFSVESLSIQSLSHLDRIERIWNVKKTIPTSFLSSNS